MTQHMHPFEQAGLGLAPFKFVGMETKEDRAGLNRYREAHGMTYTTNHCTSCDYCGTAIWDAYRVRSSDGKEFKVGCDCVTKLAKESNRKSDPVLHAIVSKANEIKAKRNRDRQDTQIVEMLEQAKRHEEILRATPHANSYWASQGQTAWDELEWFMKNAGRSGKVKALKWALKVIERSPSMSS